MISIILYMLSTWSFFGSIIYIFMFKKVRLPFQKIVLFFIGGPVVWIFITFIWFLDRIAEIIFEPMYKWLTKE
jgi:hypothetical protein